MLLTVTFLAFSISSVLLAKGSSSSPLIFVSSFTGLFLVLSLLGMSGFHFGGGGGGSIEPPKTGGGGFRKRAQLTGTINRSL